MANEFELLIIGMLGILGSLGGIPQVLKWLKPKPRLKITAADINRLQAENYKYQVHLEVENETRFWRRNGDATNVTADYYVVDKDGVQCVAALGLVLSQYLCADAKIQRTLEAYHSLTPDGNPFSVIFKVSCTEGVTTRKILSYEASPIVYT